MKYNEIKKRDYIILNNEAFEILEANLLKKDRSKSVNQVKLRNLKTYKVIEKTLHASDKIKGIEIEKYKIKYLYKNKGLIYFCPELRPQDRFSVNQNQLNPNIDLLVENTIIDANYLNGELINIKLPIKLNLKVIESPPDFRGNSMGAVTKKVKLENGLFINAPIFIKKDDYIVLNTESKEYIERINL